MNKYVRTIYLPEHLHAPLEAYLADHPKPSLSAICAGRVEQILRMEGYLPLSEQPKRSEP